MALHGLFVAYNPKMLLNIYQKAYLFVYLVHTNYVKFDRIQNCMFIVMGGVVVVFGPVYLLEK